MCFFKTVEIECASSRTSTYVPKCLSAGKHYMPLGMQRDRLVYSGMLIVFYAFTNTKIIRSGPVYVYKTKCPIKTEKPLERLQDSFCLFVLTMMNLPIEQVLTIKIGH
jgi:hypothetical protein